MAEVNQLLTKKVADRYLKREVLGEGTYGVVYKAIDTKVAPISIWISMFMWSLGFWLYYVIQ